MNKHEKYEQEIDEFTTKIDMVTNMLESQFVGLTRRSNIGSQGSKIQVMKLALDIISKYEMAETMKAMQKAFENFGKDTDAPPIKWPEGSYRIDPDDPLNLTPKIPLEIKDPWECICGSPRNSAGDIEQYIVIRNFQGDISHKIKIDADMSSIALHLECDKCDWRLTSEILMKRKEQGTSVYAPD